MPVARVPRQLCCPLEPVWVRYRRRFQSGGRRRSFHQSRELDDTGNQHPRRCPTALHRHWLDKFPPAVLPHPLAVGTFVKLLKQFITESTHDNESWLLGRWPPPGEREQCLGRHALRGRDRHQRHSPYDNCSAKGSSSDSQPWVEGCIPFGIGGTDPRRNAAVTDRRDN